MNQYNGPIGPVPVETGNGATFTIGTNDFGYNDYGYLSFLFTDKKGVVSYQDAFWAPRQSSQSQVDAPQQWQFATSYLNDIIKGGGYNELRKLLVDKYGLPTSSKGRDDAFLRSYYAALRAVSTFNAQRYELNGTKSKFLSLMDYLRQKTKDPESGGYTGPKSSVTITGKNAAKDVFRNFVSQITGKAPNKADFEDFYETLVNQQKKYVSTRSGKYKETITQNPFDLNDFTLRYIVKRLDITGDMAGKVGAVQDAINQAVNNYGLSSVVGVNTKIKLIKGLLKGKLQEQDVDDTLRDLAKTTYSAFAEDIDKNPNISFQDIISPYIQTYNKLLEKTGIDTDVSKVLGMATKDGKKLTINEFQQFLLKSDDFQSTNAAKSNAANLARSFARAFGVNV
jgi:hypothetical protein